ncbi:hypothetical protein J7643_10885 [bacterium]|nr:hypothetical protein [bacterium]
MTMKRMAPILATLLLSGCDYSLRIPFPSVYRSNSDLMGMRSHASVSAVEPTNPAFGETVTVRFENLSDTYIYSAYLYSGDGLGDPEHIPADKSTTPYFRLGNLPTQSQTATLSFELRELLGNDQYGDPFKLAHGQRVNIALTGRRKDSQGTFGTGGNVYFLIK